LEITVSLICVFVLIIAAVNIFSWMNKRLALRQEKYEMTRVLAGGTPIPMEIQIDEYTGNIKIMPPPQPFGLPAEASEFLSSGYNAVREDIVNIGVPMGQGFDPLNMFNKGSDQ